MSEIERLLVHGCTELPDCRCRKEMRLARLDPLPDRRDAHIRVYKCAAYDHASLFGLTSWPFNDNHTRWCGHSVPTRAVRDRVATGSSPSLQPSPQAIRLLFLSANLLAVASSAEGRGHYGRRHPALALRLTSRTVKCKRSRSQRTPAREGETSSPLASITSQLAVVGAPFQLWEHHAPSEVDE